MCGDYLKLLFLAYRVVSREGQLPLGVLGGGKIVHRWVYLVSKFILFYMFQVEKRSMQMLLFLLLFFIENVTVNTITDDVTDDIDTSLSSNAFLE